MLKQAGEGHDEAQQVHEEPDDDERPEAGGREERPDFDEGRGDEEGHHARGGSVSVSQSRAGSSRFGALSLRANFGVSFLVALR